MEEARNVFRAHHWQWLAHIGVPAIPKLESAEYLAGYGLKLTFEDGRVGVLDLAPEYLYEACA
jgi:hypothetical protein